MTAYPTGSHQGKSTAEIDRVAKFHDADGATVSPDTLTQIKIEVNTLDLLEASDPVTWAARIATFPVKVQAMFQGGVKQRLRCRYAAYGGDEFALSQVLGVLVAVNTAVSAWLRVPLATVEGLGISILPDALNTNPAVQATDAARPPRVAAANGLLVAQGVDDRLSWPAHASNNQLVTWGFAAHLLLDDVVAVKTLLRIGLGTSNWPQPTDSLRLAVSAAESINIAICTDATGLQIRQATSTASTLSNAAYVFVTCEVNLALVGESNQIVMSFDGVVDTLTFSDAVGTPGAPPASMQGAVTGLALFGERTNSIRLPFLGKMGPNIYILGSAMAGVTQGLLTPAARIALMNLERPSNL